MLAIIIAMSTTLAAADEAAIRELENQSWVAWKGRDGAFFERFLSDDHVEIHAHGIVGKKAVVDGVRSPACVVREYSLGPFSLTPVAGDVVLLTYRAEQDTTCGNQKVPSPVWATSLYARREGKWMNVMYQHTPQPAGASAQAAPACAAPEHRALDFWIGRWEVRSGDEVVAESVIERSKEACAIAEHYRQRDGYTGTSHSFYDAALHKWRQTWIDSSGAVGEFTGEAKPGEMAFTGETHRPNATRVQRRMTLTALPDGTVRQHSLASTDDGATWKPHYDFTYRRRP